MARRPLTFKQRDLTRALRAAHRFAADAGLPASAVRARIEPCGAFQVWVADGEEPAGLQSPVGATVETDNRVEGTV